MTFQWNQILTAAEIEAHHALTASIDPRFANNDRAWYASRTAAQLRAAAAGAWDSNNRGAYVLANSYAALGA